MLKQLLLVIFTTLALNLHNTCGDLKHRNVHESPILFFDSGQLRETRSLTPPPFLADVTENPDEYVTVVVTMQPPSSTTESDEVSEGQVETENEDEEEKSTSKCSESRTTTELCTNDKIEQITSETWLNYPENRNEYADSDDKTKRSIKSFLNRVFGRTMAAQTTTVVDNAPQAVTELTPSLDDHTQVAETEFSIATVPQNYQQYSESQVSGGQQQVLVIPPFSTLIPAIQEQNRAVRNTPHSKSAEGMRRNLTDHHKGKKNKRRKTLRKDNKDPLGPCHEPCDQSSTRLGEYQNTQEEDLHKEADGNRNAASELPQIAAVEPYEPDSECMETSTETGTGENGSIKAGDEPGTELETSEEGNNPALLDAKIQIGDRLGAFLSEMMSPGEKRLRIVEDAQEEPHNQVKWEVIEDNSPSPGIVHALQASETRDNNEDGISIASRESFYSIARGSLVVDHLPTKRLRNANEVISETPTMSDGDGTSSRKPSREPRVNQLSIPNHYGIDGITVL